MSVPTLRYYAAGSTHHRLSGIFRGAPRRTVTFPSGVFLFDDGERRVLFDTGYAARPWRTGIVGRLYSALLPPSILPEQTAAAQLRRDGIDPGSITHVVLSHLHPDHVGGVRDFDAATFVLTEGHVETLRSPRVKEGLLRGLLPAWFDAAPRIVVAESEFTPLTIGEGAGVEVHARSLFGGDRLHLVALPGHARGHVGLLVDRTVLLAGDAAWSVEFLRNMADLRAVPAWIQADVDEYQASARELQRLIDVGIRVICSHDTVTESVIL